MSLFSGEHDEMIARRGERLALEAAVDRLYLEAGESQHEIQLTLSDDADGEVVGLAQERQRVVHALQAHERVEGADGEAVALPWIQTARVSDDPPDAPAF